MLDEAVGHAGDVNQAVLMHADVHEGAEVNDVAHGAGEFHAGLQILHVQHVGAQNGLGQLVAGVAAGLLQFGKNIVEGGQADAQFLRQLFHAILFRFQSNARQAAVFHVLGLVTQSG